MPQNRPVEVLVTGATGKQGGALALALIARGHKVRALTRRPESPAAEALRQQGAVLAMGSFDDSGSLERAIAGTDAVFAMSTPFEAGSGAETRQGIALIDAARKAGAKHFVFTSIASAGEKTGVAHMESKRPVEAHLAGAGLPYTIVAPVFFMENFIGPWLPPLKEGKLLMALPAGRKLQQIAVEDVGAFAAMVIEQRDQFLGKRIDIASDEVNGNEAAEILSRASGRKLEYTEQPMAEMRAFSEDVAGMMEWFDRVGYKVDIAGLRRDQPDVGWHTLEAWAQQQDWKTLLR